MWAKGGELVAKVASARMRGDSWPCRASAKYSTGFVTAAAVAQREANKRAGRWIHQDLQHEHVVTKKYLKKRMRLVGNATPLLEATACVVTKEEHKAMKSTAHGWQRYLHSGSSCSETPA
jgi:hypothetical protein